MEHLDPQIHSFMPRGVPAGKLSHHRPVASRSLTLGLRAPGPRHWVLSVAKHNVGSLQSLSAEGGQK